MFIKLVLAIFLAITSSAFAITKKNGLSYISMPVHKRSDLEKRDLVQGTTETDLPQSFYYTTIQVGSNKDDVALMVDTGSWASNILTPNVTCSHGNCTKFGNYDPTKSTSAKIIGTSHIENFGYNYIYTGTTVIDDVYFNGVKIPNYLFASVYNNTAWPAGLFGFSKPPKSETNMSISWAARNANLINQAAYSMYLSTIDGKPGGIILGAIDYGKINGDLHWANLTGHNVGGFIDSFEINGHNVSIGRDFTADTGGSYFNLKEAEYEQFLDSLPNDPQNPRGSKTINFDLLKGKTSKLKINGAVLEFPLDAIIHPGDSGPHARIIVRQNDQVQLGSFFFRYLYFAVSLEKEAIGWGVTNDGSNSFLGSFPSSYHL
ncbi:unnamed protein product [Candida verbasci]|uniref:Peptidase A1 domain-containing protein n=1 Tax=Candida verbasci TaxID=1227364 RepID=A0A9W4XCR2_9ASCO|nr:unnamed protein product [Candida verbasci]